MLTDDRVESLLRMYMPISTHGEARRLARAVEREARREALEEALRSLPECGVGNYLYEQALNDCAAAIRALKERP